MEKLVQEKHQYSSFKGEAFEVILATTQTVEHWNDALVEDNLDNH